MTTEKKVTCIICPIGCKILTKKEGRGCEVIEGHKCKQGIDYARDETLNPTRMLTTSVLVEGGEWPLVSVKTTNAVSKKKIFPVLKEIKKTKLKAPVKSGQTIIKNIVNTGIDIVATKTVKKL